MQSHHTVSLFKVLKTFKVSGLLYFFCHIEIIEDQDNKQTSVLEVEIPLEGNKE